MDDDEVFDLGTLDQYELVSNDDGTVLIQDNCVVIKHNETHTMKMLPLTEEVLHALGLAVVLDDDDKQDEAKKSGEGGSMATRVEVEEHLDDQLDKIDTVFTDDEDGEFSKISEANKSGNSEKDALIWSTPMVNLLLDLYEKNQSRFYTSDTKHRVIWREIYKKMCEEYPEMKNWNESNVHSKFGGLKRTYRGAVEYLKDNLHTTKWPFFERMHKLMNNMADLENSVSKKLFNNEVVFASESETDKSPKKKDAWPAACTLRLLRAYEVRADLAHEAGFWERLRRELAADLGPLAAAQLQQKFFSLKRAYKLYCESDVIGSEIKDPEVLEILSRIHVDSDDDYDIEELEADFDYSADEDDPKGKPEHETWGRAMTELVLSAAGGALARVRRGSPAARVWRDVSVELRARGRLVRPASVARGVRALRRRLRRECAAGEPTTWPYFQKALKVFGKPTEIWTRANTQILLDLYEETKEILDESGPKFWSELAKKFKEQRPTQPVNPHTCEMKMQTLFLKYKSLLQSKGKKSEEWPLFQKMHSIFNSKSTPWPNKTIQLFLAVFQANMSRFETSEDQDAIWEDIAKEINNVQHMEQLVWAESCRDKLTELKSKYCKLMRDEEAARAWPLYKRMSELFSPSNWSTFNISLLLDTYAALRPTVTADGPDGADAPLWERVATVLRAGSVTACPLGAHCHTELCVLRARTRAGAAGRLTYYKKMQELFGDEDSKTKSPEAAIKETNNKIKIEPPEEIDPDEEAGWDVARTRRMLRAVAAARRVGASAPSGRAADRYRRLRRTYRRGVTARWPYVEEMEQILAAGDESSSGSDDDMLRTMLRTRLGSRAQSDEQHDSASSPKRKKGRWSEDEMLSLIDTYEKNHDKFELDLESAESAWVEVVRQMKDLYPDFDKTQTECEEKITHMQTIYEYGSKLPSSLQLPPKVFQKMKEFNSEEPTNCTNGDEINGDSDVFHEILEELKRKNKINVRRCDLLEKNREDNRKQHEEKIEMMNKIHIAINDVIQSRGDKSDVMRLLERTLEEIHK